MAYTTIDDPSQYFDIVTYAGDGGSSKTITGLDFQADFLWIKNRTEARDHILANLKFNPPIIGAYDAVGGSTDTAINLSVSADTKNYVVFNEALIAGYDGKGLVTINLTLSNNAKIGSRFSGLPGLDFRGFPTNCVLNLTINSGSAIYGCGGAGGRGGGWGNTAPSGSAGGDAIWLDKATTIVNNGTVAGGGGGGGGGAGWAPTGAYGMGGAGGGGGAGFDGGAGGSKEDSSANVSAASDGSAGSTSGGGSGGSGSSKDGYTTHSGATGGGLGAAGGGSTGSHTSWAGQGSSGGSGGAGGKYTDGNTYATWSTEGTRTGSANDSVTNGVALSPYLSLPSTSNLQTDTDRLLEINSSGFKVGADNTVNENSTNLVAFAWKAKNGAATFNDASSTGVGSIDSVHEANQEAGFSIVTYTGNNTEGATFAHGLGAAPELVIVKGLNTSDNWTVFNGTSTTTSRSLFLQATDAEIPVSSYNFWNLYWDETRPSSTVVTLGVDNSVNGSGGNKTYVAYCFRSIQGYSKIGKYVGNGDASNGTFVYTGFKPAWVMSKKTTSASNFDIDDSGRNPFNPTDKRLFTNFNAAEVTGTSRDFLSNGFKMYNTHGGQNTSGQSYVYMAFAENPFVSSEGVPTTAR